MSNEKRTGMKILLVVYDNDSFIHWFPQGTAYIASALRNAGHFVSIWNQDFHHYSDSSLTDYIDNEDFDMIGIGFIAGYYQYRKILGLTAAIKNAKKRPIVVLGGHGPAPDPDYFLKKCNADVVVIGEGEETMVELASAIIERQDLSKICGIAWRKDDKTIFNRPRGVIKDIDSIPMPAFDLFPMSYYRLIRFPHVPPSAFAFPVLSGRGCPFNCNFCYRMDKGYRPRSIEAIIEEIRFLQNNYGISYINFSDELLMVSVDRTTQLCEAFLKNDLNIHWWCNGRLNYAQPELLKLMKRSGCVFINYGIESLDDEVLKIMHKSLNVSQIESGIVSTLEAGISPGFNIIFGHIGDTRDTLEKGVQFLLKYSDGAQLRTIRPVTPYPGSELFTEAVKRGKLRDVQDFYENKHLNSDLLAVNFTDLSDEEFHQALFEANSKLVQAYYDMQSKRSVGELRQLYTGKNRNFRGFRQT